MSIAPKTNGIIIPPELEATRDAALRAIGLVRPADESTRADAKFLFNAERTEAGRSLPPYYLVYFLLVDLLGFRNLGKFEKLAWSIPVDFNGRAFLIEHRKLGVGVFTHDAVADNDEAREIVTLIQKGVKAGEPFFEWLAERAVRNSKLNVDNNSESLFSRYNYFLSAYQKADAEATARAKERYTEKRVYEGGSTTITHFPGIELRENARWLALATIDAFFSWTEHVFIHIAILSGELKTGLDVAGLAESDWQKKFKCALDLSDATTKGLFDQLVDIRRQLRNFIAHGAFGKQGEAFHFHSGAGAVPVLLPHKAGKSRFALSGDFAFEETAALTVIENFIRHLWSGEREPAELYIQKARLPSILTLAADGTYAKAMASLEDMDEFVKHLSGQFDQAANMDW
jgi:hypothetical protein